MRSKRLPGLPVICITTGDQLGRVKRAIIDPQAKRVAGLAVAGSTFGGRRVLPINAVHALGSHAVTVAQAEDLRHPKDEGAAELVARDRVKVVGAPVITARGVLVGTVVDYEIGERGSIDQLYVSQNLWKAIAGGDLSVPGEMLIALGRDAAIVADELLEHVKPARESKPRRTKAEASPPSADESHLEDANKDGRANVSAAAERVRGFVRQTLTR